jgi:peptide deformylase
MKITEFGNPLLRKKARELTNEEIKSEKVQKLIKDMREFLVSKKMGVGLAAPQVGDDSSLALVSIRPTNNRKDAGEFELVIINPKITRTFGNRRQEWEGCLSGGALKSGLFAKVPRYKKIELVYNDEKGVRQRKTFEGLAAHVLQHEVDHLNGVLFVDKVRDTSSYVTYREYMRINKAEAKKKS